MCKPLRGGRGEVYALEVIREGGGTPRLGGATPGLKNRKGVLPGKDVGGYSGVISRIYVRNDVEVSFGGTAGIMVGKAISPSPAPSQ